MSLERATTATGWDAAVSLARRWSSASQLVVLHRGEIVIDEAHGCEPTDLFWPFSASKPFSLVVVLQLAESGVLSLEDPVSRYWPAFAGGGKGEVTIRQVVEHRSGFSTGGSMLGDMLAIANWERSTRRIARTRLVSEPGTASAYQFLAFGFVLGEIVKGATGRPIGDVMRERVLEPLALENTHLGLDRALLPRAVPLRSPGTSRIMDFGINTAYVRRAVIPAAGLSTTARDLAEFYRVLLAGGITARGDRLLAAATIADALRPIADEYDAYARSNIHWATGFQLGGPRTVAGALPPMGTRSTERTFGHNGSNCCIAWADPDRDLVFAYTTNRLADRFAAVEHLCGIADAVFDAAEAAG